MNCPICGSYNIQINVENVGFQENPYYQDEGYKCLTCWSEFEEPNGKEESSQGTGQDSITDSQEERREMRNLRPSI